jgi:hypothetical protein
MPIDNNRRVGISQMRQGGFSAHNAAAGVVITTPQLNEATEFGSRPYVNLSVAPFDMGWIYIQQVMRTGSTIFGRPEDYYRITAFTADGSASAQITENSTAHNQIEENWVIPVRPGVFVFAHGFFDVTGGAADPDDGTDFYVVGNQALLIEAASVSAITLSSAAKSLIFTEWRTGTYYNQAWWAGNDTGENGSDFNVNTRVNIRMGDGSWLDTPSTAPPLIRVSTAAGSCFGQAPEGSIPNPPPSGTRAKYSPWLRLPGSQPSPIYKAELQIDSVWTLVDDGPQVTTARDMADFDITTADTGPWGTAALGGHQGNLIVALSYHASTDYTADWAGLGMTL